MANQLTDVFTAAFLHWFSGSKAVDAREWPQLCHRSEDGEHVGISLRYRVLCFALNPADAALYDKTKGLYRHTELNLQPEYTTAAAAVTSGYLRMRKPLDMRPYQKEFPNDQKLLLQRSLADLERLRQQPPSYNRQSRSKDLFRVLHAQRRGAARETRTGDPEFPEQHEHEDAIRALTGAPGGRLDRQSLMRKNDTETVDKLQALGYDSFIFYSDKHVLPVFAVFSRDQFWPLAQALQPGVKLRMRPGQVA